MAILQSGEIKINLTVERILGDRSDRSVAEAEYLISFQIPGFTIEKVLVTDDQPDSFYSCFFDAMDRACSTVHNTIDNQFSIGVYPAGAHDELAWHTLPIEPDDFAGDSENAFKVIVCLNPGGNFPLGSGVAAVVSVSRKSMEFFLKEWVAEMEKAPRSEDYQGEYLLRWMPNRKNT